MPLRLLGLLIAFVLVVQPDSLAQQSGTQFFDSNGVQLHYVDRGRGEPVVLIHGFTGSYARHIEGPGLMDRLEKAGYRAIGMDCRGHGQSGKPTDATQYGMEMVQDVIRLMDHLKVERAHIFGYSMGGAIASQLLVKHPDRVRTVTLLGSGWEGENLDNFGSMM
jgi:pimeloyl-ACP methyl ester carboxylesterase